MTKGGQFAVKSQIPCIGICFARTQDSSDIELLHALCKDLKQAGMRTLTFQFMSDLKNEDSKDAGELVLLKLIPFAHLDAMVLFTESIRNRAVIDAIVARVKLEGIPILTMNRACEGCFHVRYGVEDAFSSLMEHILTEHQCKKIAFLAGIKGNEYSETRLQIYREALAAHGIPYDEKLVKYGDFWYAPAQKATLEFLQECKGALPDAICCANDAMAMTVCQELENNGIRVPQDVIVTGFDGTYAEQFFRPRLTTAAMNYDNISRATTNLLQKIFAQPDMAPCSVTVPYVIRIGQSCGCKEIVIGDTGKQLMNVYLNLEGYRYFYSAMHDMTSKMLEESYPMEELPKRLLESNFGIAWTRCSLILTRQTVLSLGLLSDATLTECPTVEVCRWSEQYGNSTPMKPFASDFLVDDPEILFAEAKSNAVMVTALHEQGQVLGYLVMAYEPATPDFDDTKLDYGRLLNYQSSIAHILSALISRHSLLEFNAQLERLYVYDSMTNLNNRRGFFQHLSYAMSEKALYTEDYWVCIAAIDMDGLKYINDTFGHAEGDDAIIATAQILMQTAPAGSIVARFGGDEFMVAVLLDTNDKNFEPMFRRDMQMKIDAYNRNIQKDYCIGASCGFEIAKYVEGMDIDVVMKAADDQLYLDKARHKCLRGIRRKP